MNRLPGWISRRETISSTGGLENVNRQRHLLVSMHPSEIPVAPSQILLVIGAARACQQDLEQKGLWQVIPERRAEFLRVLQFN
jgi:hypothetical protein